MTDAFTHVWTHGTAVQINKNEMEGPTPSYLHLDFTYNGDGFEIAPPKVGGIYFSDWIATVYLPIITPATLSDALTSFYALHFRYKTQGTGEITSLRLLRNSGIEYATDQLLNNLPLCGDYLNGQQLGKNYWTPLHPNSNLIDRGGLCLEIIIQFASSEDPHQEPPFVRIAEAGVIFQHKKFDYKN
ncbi:hypothetical protein COM64_20520 [Bacillus toyonensis]|uniref:hypothetical protein n=1 Tax=Bacillus toyonensis TaxID=155322 RepID=UPI000BF521A2|nr:hypothetical protein [Bacillus toyonensis]PGE16340.1 hypothetical protein COM64_20520 [Bacillus toyonensis]